MAEPRVRRRVVLDATRGLAFLVSGGRALPHHYHKRGTNSRCVE